MAFLWQKHFWCQIFVLSCFLVCVIGQPELLEDNDCDDYIGDDFKLGGGHCVKRQRIDSKDFSSLAFDCKLPEFAAKDEEYWYNSGVNNSPIKKGCM